MPSTIIDFHVHAFPNPADRLAHHLPGSFAQYLPAGTQEAVVHLRRQARSWTRTLSHSLHNAQTLLRHLPDPLRNGLDELAGLAPLANLLFESTVGDLLEEMEENEVDRARLVAQPPLTGNDFVMEACAQDPRLLAVVNIPPEQPKPATTLKRYARLGARALKIHPALDGEGVESSRYRKLIRTATELGLPVILDTGRFHLRMNYRDPSKGDVREFEPWFAEFTETPFILAHMNLHQPEIAIDLALTYPNLYLETSWQPAEIMGEAVRRMGAERILFGTDWPIVGDNFAVGRSRIEDCIATELMTEEQSRMILGENAKKLLGL
jgi:predicted TIM-barrel fold metal-dependent hydrolase